MNLNRAVHEDIVAVEILPKNQWSCPSSVITTSASTENADDNEDGDDESTNGSNGNDLNKVCDMVTVLNRFCEPCDSVKQSLKLLFSHYSEI